MQRFDYNHILEYEVTPFVVVGPSETLVDYSIGNNNPTDTDTISLAPINGDDADPGTEAQPVKTLERAIDLLQSGAPTITTIQVIRNGGSGDLEIELTDDHNSPENLPDSSIIQTESGETCTLHLRDGGAITDGQNITIMNFFIKLHGQNGAGTNTRFSFSGFINSCDVLIDDDIKISSSADGFITLSNNPFNVGGFMNSSIHSSVSQMAVPYIIFLTNNSSSTIMNNCLLYDLKITTEVTNGGILVLSGSTNILVNHCTIYNCLSPGSLIGMNEGNTCNCTFMNSIVKESIVPIFKFGSGAFNIGLSINNNIFSNVFNQNSIVAGALDLAGGTGSVSIEENLNGIIPLFFSESDGDFRLQDKRRKIPNTDDNFLFTSRGVHNTEIGQTPSNDGMDLGPYQQSYVLTKDSWSTYVLETDYWNSLVRIDRRFVNYQSFNDLRGNFRRAFDSLKRRIEFEPISNKWIGSRESYQFNRLIEANGAKRWYPLTDDNGNELPLFSDTSVAVTENNDGSFEAALNNSNLINRLEPDSFIGFICNLSSGAAEFDLRIRTHGSGTFTLEDHRRNQSSMSSGTYDLSCDYLPVEIDMDGAATEYEFWDADKNPLMIPEDEENLPNNWQEGHLRGLVVAETEEDI